MYNICIQLIVLFPGSPGKLLGMRLCNYSNRHVCGYSNQMVTNHTQTCVQLWKPHGCMWYLRKYTKINSRTYTKKTQSHYTMWLSTCGLPLPGWGIILAARMENCLVTFTTFGCSCKKKHPVILSLSAYFHRHRLSSLASFTGLPTVQLLQAIITEWWEGLGMRLDHIYNVS